jgi:hypothetical protein
MMEVACAWREGWGMVLLCASGGNMVLVVITAYERKDRGETELYHEISGAARSKGPFGLLPLINIH